MKNFILALLTLFSICGCHNGKEQYTSIYLFIDVTDTIFKNPETYLSDIPIIIKEIGIDTIRGGFNGGEVKMFLLNNVSQTKSVTVKLNKGISGLLGQNELDRMDEIKTFYKKLNQGINDLLASIEFQREQSKIYQNICRELNTLSNTHSDKKIVIIYSDMLENSNLFTFYGEISKIQSYINDINSAMQELSKDCSLPELSAIDVHIVTIRTKETDEKINLAEQFWTKLFMSKNCQVTFDVELNL